jgi:geranylgeranyl diphosphate synthase type I
MSSNSNEDFIQPYLESIECELQRAVERANKFGNSRLYDMLTYHMGWNNQPGGAVLRGKRIRPLLVLLTCAAAGGEWGRALPAASAVELVHNFSLIHDDIEDHSPLRRGRPTVWKKWGIPKAINAGDAMFALAHLEAIRLAETVSLGMAMEAAELLQNTCLHLTQGQYLDLSYEKRKDLTVNDYLLMVEGKTAALIATCVRLGAMAAFCDAKTTDYYAGFGHSLGLAFQIQDDLLGIWGNSSLTGKSSHSDLVTGKITLPVLYGLSRNGDFARLWKQGPIPLEEVPALIQALEAEDGKEFTEGQVSKFTQEAMKRLSQAHPSGDAAEALKYLALSLVDRQV